MAIFLLSIIALITFLFRIAVHNSTVYGIKSIHKLPLIVGIIIFCLFVGFRYNPEIDNDFLNYWYVAEMGPEFYEYYRFEPIPRILADLVLYYQLSPSYWFLIMGLFLIVFTIYAASRINNRYLPYVFYGLILLYFKFDMNVVRQGVALSVLLCAITYIIEKDWKRYVLFVVIASCFHVSSLMLTPLYLLNLLSWERNYRKNYLLIVIIVFCGMSSLVFILSRMSYILGLIGFNIDPSNMMALDDKGSGLGIILRYIRWGLLLLYVPKVAVAKRDFKMLLLLGVFLVGVVMDSFSMYYIFLARVALYTQIVELLLYPYIIKENRYIGKLKQIAPCVLLVQAVLITYVISGYLANWKFV